MIARTVLGPTNDILLVNLNIVCSSMGFSNSVCRIDLCVNGAIVQVIGASANMAHNVNFTNTPICVKAGSYISIKTWDNVSLFGNIVYLDGSGRPSTQNFSFKNSDYIDYTDAPKTWEIL